MKKIALITLFIGVALQFYFYSQMPDTVAIRYELDGRAVAWASRMWLMIYGIGMYAVLNICFYLCGHVYGIKNIKAFNIPNKDYWTDPTRIGQTGRRIAGWYDEMIVLSNCFLIIMFGLNYKVNMSESVEINIVLFFILLGVYGGVLVWSSLKFYSQFKKIT